MSNSACARWTAEEDARLEELAAAGYSDAEVAELIGRTEDSVFRRRRTKRIRLNTKRKDSKFWTTEELKQLSELYDTGEYTIAALAKRFNSSVSNVQKRLKDDRIRREWTDEIIEQCTEMRRSGMTYVEIANIVGSRPSTVNTVLTRRYPEFRKSNKPTLCWDCQNARAGACSWFTDYTPVLGWKVEQTAYENTTSYVVSKCPNFVRDEERSCVWSKST